MISRLFVLSTLALATVAGCSSAPADSQTSGSDEALGKRRCRSNAQCGALEFCDNAASHSCNGPGLCTPRGINLMCIHTTAKVCGCDGKTYDGSCPAHKAGTSVAHDGACACAFNSTSIDGDTLAEMPWDNQSETYFYVFTGSGTTVNDSGTFQLRIEPPCLRTQPSCKIAIQEKNGSFYAYGSTLELDYDNGDVAFFDAQADCNNAVQLVGDDQGQRMTLKVTTITP